MNNQKNKLSGLLNQAMLSVMGMLFCVFALKKGISDKAGILMMLIGIILIVMGVVRYLLVKKLLREVAEIDQETMELFEQNQSEEKEG